MVKRLFFLCAISFVFASNRGHVISLEPIRAETPGMQSLIDPEASTAIASPVEWWVRSSDESGLLGRESAWNAKNSEFGTLVDSRELPIRRWRIQQPGFGVKVGNEVGDYILQETTEGPSKGNRTPTIDVWTATPQLFGFSAYGEMRQVDHFGERSRDSRFKQVGPGNLDDPDGRFAWFGENYPGYSSLRGGLAWQEGAYAVNALAGIEYFWVLDRNGYWRGLKSVKWEALAQLNQVSLRIIRDSLSWRDLSGDTLLKGSQVQTRGQIKWQTLCSRPNVISLAFGMDWMLAKNHGDYPFEADDSLRAFPWTYLRMPFHDFVWSAWGGANGKDWRVDDTLSFRHDFWLLETRTQTGSRPHPFAMEHSRGFFIQDLKTGILQSGDLWQIRLELIPWLQTGEYSMQGIRKTMELKIGNQTYKGMLGATHENRFGEDWQKQEWQPSRLVAWSGAEWNFKTHLRVSHVWQWQSAMHWNTMVNGNPVVESTDGRIVWNASLHQEFPKQGLTLEATWIHVLVGDVVEVPGTNDDRTRFLCELKKSF